MPGGAGPGGVVELLVVAVKVRAADEGHDSQELVEEDVTDLELSDGRDTRIMKKVKTSAATKPIASPQRLGLGRVTFGCLSFG